MCFSIEFQVQQRSRTLNYPEICRRIVQPAWTGKGDPDGDTCIVMYGGGVTSYEAARRSIERFGPDRTEVWFADTNIEDQDLYRFNRQVQDLLGIRFERFSNNNDTIWDVFFRERALGNSRIDPCSKYLKRKPLREALDARYSFFKCGACGWFGEDPEVLNFRTLARGKPWPLAICPNCEPDDEAMRSDLQEARERAELQDLRNDRGAELRDRLTLWSALEPADKDGHTVRIVLGMDDIEDCDRINKAMGYWHPYRTWFPLTGETAVFKATIMDQLAEQGVLPPRLYKWGFQHNNCGGFCVKAGLGQMAHLYATMPERYMEHAMMEQKFRETINPNVSIFTQTRDGVKRPLTMLELKDRIEAGEEFRFKEAEETLMCTCFNPELDG